MWYSLFDCKNEEFLFRYHELNSYGSWKYKWKSWNGVSLIFNTFQGEDSYFDLVYLEDISSARLSKVLNSSIRRENVLLVPIEFSSNEVIIMYDLAEKL